MTFKNIKGKSVNLIDYCKSMYKKHPDLVLYVGTDSQNKKKVTTYATVIAFRYERKGAHIIFTKSNVPKIRDRFRRLWKEVELTSDVALNLRENHVPVHVIELDFNKGDVTAGSHSMVDSGIGYFKGLGFIEVNAKPAEQLAVKAANHLVQ